MITHRQALEFGGGDGPARLPLNGKRKGILGVHRPRNNQGHMAVPNPNLCSQSGLGDPEGFESCLEVAHASKFTAPLQKVNSAANFQVLQTPYNASMANWIYRDAFDARYREYRKHTGATVEDIAQALGKSVSSVNSWRRKGGGTTPPKEALIKAAVLFGCSPFEFMVDDRLLVEELPQTSSMSPMTRERFGKMAQHLQDLPLSEYDIDILFANFFRDAQERAVANMLREKK